jgi:hypothetical protein
MILSLVGFLIFLFFRDFSFSIPKFHKNNGEIINPNATYSIGDIRDALARSKIEYSTVAISSSSGSLRADLPEGTQVFFSYEKEIEWQISSLQSILQRLTIENKIPSVIDLRYNRPIVKFVK